jgi:DNA-binding response OmpR family regulator
MTDFSVLILDDDEMWLARHERRLTHARINCRSTQLGKDAIKIARTDPSIKYALIDEILYVPPVPVEEANRELQQYLGVGVIRKINAYRPDVQFIMVTAAPQLRSGGDNRLLTQETSKLRRQHGVIDIIHKQDIENNPAREYGWLIDLLRKPQPSKTGQVVAQQVLIGLGFDKKIYIAIAELSKNPKANWLPLKALSAQKGHERALDQCMKSANEKSVFIEMSGSKKIDRCDSIRPNSQGFNILMLLAERAEKHEDVVISEDDYKCFRKYKPRRTLNDTEAMPDVDSDIAKDCSEKIAKDFPKMIAKDFLYEGVSFERSQRRKSTIRVAIHRLSQKLAGLNLGPSRHIFQDFEQGRYRPSFKISIVLYPIDLLKH